MLNHCEPICCDYGLANDKMFVSTCGTGFDALVANDFAGAGDRGIADPPGLQEKADAGAHDGDHQQTVPPGEGCLGDVFHAPGYCILCPADHFCQVKTAVRLMSGDFFIGAEVTHCQVADVIPGLETRLRGSINNSLFMDTIKAKDVILHRESNAPFHIDGDPVDMPQDIHIRIVPEGLKVLAEKRF